MSNISLNSESIKYDIIIVGAGLSGLVAAVRTLRKESTLKLVILEASERCGGQILSGDHGELGSQWIDESHRHIRSLCEELNIQLISRTIEGTNLKRIWDIDRGFWSFLVKYELNRFIKYIDTISKNHFRGSRYQFLPSFTMEKFVCNCLFFESSRNMMRLLIRALCGVTPSYISCNEFLMLCNTNDGLSSQLKSLTGFGTQYLVVPYFGRIIEALLEKIPAENIVLNAKVCKVLQYSNNVYIKTINGQEYCASLAIMSVPFQEVQRIHFIPQLPMYQEISLQSQRNMVTSFIAHYQQPHWRLQGQSGSYFLHKPPVIFYETRPLTISGMIYHHDDASNDMVHANRVLRIFHDQFGPTTSPLHWQHTTWEQAAIFSVQPKTVCNRLIWASSSTGVQYRGYANGAVQSGMRATMLALLELRPQLITWEDVTEIEHANAMPKTVGFFDCFVSSLNLYNCTLWGLTFTGLYLLKSKWIEYGFSINKNLP